MTVFMANLTMRVDRTPDCYANKPAFCNNITCVEPSQGHHYNYSFSVCEQPISLTFSNESGNAAYHESQTIRLFGVYDAKLTLDTLSEDMVRVKVRIWTIHLDTS